MSSDLSKISSSFAISTSEIEKWKTNTSNCDSIKIIEIENCPTTLEASKLVSNSIFRSSLESLKNFVIIIFKINEEITEKHAEKPKIYELNEIKRNFLISYESNSAANEKIIFWKNGMEGKYLTINLLNEYSAKVTDFVRNFLIESVNMNLEISHYKNLELINLSDSSNLNLLMKAIENEHSVALVDELLNLPFDINQKSIDGKTAADIAYEKKNNQILLKLFEANSTFPNNFNIAELETDEASEKIEQIMTISINLHDAIETGNSPVVQRIIDENLNLTYFYNSSNVSAATKAIKSDKLEIYRILLEHECSIGPEEHFNQIANEAFEKCESNEPMIKRMKSELLSAHDDTSIKLLEKHLMILCANSVISHDNQSARMRIRLIKDAFKVLNEIPIAKQILQLTSMHNNFKIYFDFNRSSVEFMNPFNGDQSMRGICENIEIRKFYLYIGAKMLLDDGSALGTLAHELCHFAMNLTFCNDAKPYAIDDEVNEKRFNGIIEKYSGLVDFEQIVSLVFKYDQNEWPAELIVRIPHMIVHYQNDSNRLNELKVTFKDLFDYYNDVVVAQMSKTLQMLEILFNYSYEISFNNLTDAYKAKLHHSNINFQGNEVKYHEIIEDKNTEIYQHLSSKKIRKILIENINLTIERTQETKTKFYTERNFIEFDIILEREILKEVWKENVLNNLLNFDQISSIADETKMILLSDHAGAGKTITFQYLSVKLKSKFPNFWISYIDLKRHLEIYEKHENNFHVLEVLQEILSITDEFEAKLFTKLFNSGKIILLYDGLDEISPKFKDFFLNFIESVRNSTKILQWIATRPQHMQELRVKFNQKAYKLLPFDVDNKVEFIHSVLKNLNIVNVKAESVLNDINLISSFANYIDSPLMLQIMTELHLNDKILRNYDLFSLYDEMIDMKNKILSKKGEIANDDRDNRKAKLTIWQVHQIYAIKLLYKDGFRDRLNDDNVDSDYDDDSDKIMININEFQLLKRWKKEKSKWTPEAISRYGFLYVDNWNTNREFPDYVHRTFAEFFAAQFIIQDLYELNEDDDDDEMSEKEIELRFKFLIEVGRFHNGIQKFILSFIDIHESKKMHKYFYKLITSNAIRKLFIENNSTMEDLLKIFIVDERFLKEFRFNDNMTIFQYLMNEIYLNDIQIIISIYKSSLGDDWINHTGYAVKENSMNIDNDEVLKQESIKYGRWNWNYENAKALHDFLNSIYQLELSKNDIMNFLNINFDSICEKAFNSSILTQQLMKFVQNNFEKCKNEFLIMKIRPMNSLLNNNYFLDNGKEFLEKLEQFLLLDETICVDDIKCFIIKLNFALLGIKSIIKSYEEKKIKKHDIQQFLIKYSVEFIDYISSLNFNISLEYFDTFLREIFDVQSERNTLKKFLETKCESENEKFNNHTVLSYLNKIIDDFANESEDKKKLIRFKTNLLELAKEVYITDDQT